MEKAPTEEQHHILCKSLKSVTGTLAVIKQAFEEESINSIRKVQTHRDKKGEIIEEKKSRACSSFSLTSKRLFTKNSSRQARQLISLVTATSYGDCFKMCEDFNQNFGDKTTGCCITTTHCLTLSFSPGNF
jgi:hypothetical protein